MIEIIKLDIDKNDKNNFDLVFKINDIQISIGNYDDGCTIHHKDNHDMVYVQVEREPNDEIEHDIRIATKKEETTWVEHTTY